MTLGPQEIVRSEVEGGLSGPTNSLTPESIDCGCGGYQMPRLVKFATRRIFLALLCCIGLLQAAAQAYFYVTSSTIARRFQFDPYLMEWIICLSEIVPVLVGLVVAYWGDRFHRATWLGGLTLIQCASFFSFLIPHFSHWTNVIEETENVTHMAMYADENPDLCMRMSSKLVMIEDPPFYTTLFILIVVQIITGMANVAYYALGISYLDDNSERINVPVYLGVILAIKILGNILGYVIGWSFLRIDADNFSAIQSYRDQIGAWWFGWPIFAILLAVPAVLMAIFPRKLPSEMVEEAASTILDQSGTLRGSQRIPVKKVGNPEFLPSMFRLLTNKILILNLLAAAFFMTALVNFLANENIFLESRFYAPRPTGMLLGFGDPLLSRTITTIMKPMLVGLTIIISGLVIARAKPKARLLVIYSFIVFIVSAILIFSLAFDNCEKSRIVGYRRGSFDLMRYCNYDCRCSRNADFRPICDNKGTFIFYSPCHAGCTTVGYENNIKVYSNCTCVEDITGLGNFEAREGPCGSDSCQVGWLIYEILTLVVYGAAASTIIGDLLIGLRSVNVQDKALTIGYSMAILGFFVYVPGKASYDELTKAACQHWGPDDHICHLHHPTNLGYYLSFLTTGLIIIGALLKAGVWIFCENLEIYDPIETEETQGREMKDMAKTQAEPLLQQPSQEQQDLNGSQRIEAVNNPVEPVIIIEHKKLTKENGPVEDVVEEQPPSRLKYGPTGPGDRRVANNQSKDSIAVTNTDDELDSSDDSQILRKGSASQVSYKPLEIDSDAESDLSGAVAGLRKRIPSTDIDEPSKPLQGIRPPFSNIRFPNPDNYEDPRYARSSRNNSPSLLATDGSSKTNSFEFSRKRRDDIPLSTPTPMTTPVATPTTTSPPQGDFNEVGIPLVDPQYVAIKSPTSSVRSPTIMMAIQQLDREPKQIFRDLHEQKFVDKPMRRKDSEEIEENRKFRLERLMQPIDYSPPAPRPPSRDQASSGFGSLQDVRERMRLNDVSDSRDSLSSKSSTSGPPKKGGPLCTDL